MNRQWVSYDFNAMTTPGRAIVSKYSDTIYTNFISWGDLEPYQGTYAWWRLDNFLNAYSEKMDKAHICIVLLDPTSRPWYGATGYGQLPSWLATQLNAVGQCRWGTTFEGFSIDAPASVPYTKYTEGAMLCEPFYWSKEFLNAHASFVYALAKRFYFNDVATAGYSGAPDWCDKISTVELGSYGVWGEWHSDIQWPSDEIKRNTLKALIQHFWSAFDSYAREARKPLPEFELSCVGSTVGADIYLKHDPQCCRYAVEDLGFNMVRKFIGADKFKFLRGDEERFIRNNVGRRRLRLEWGSASGEISQEAFGGMGGTPDTVSGAITRAKVLGCTRLGWFAENPLATDYVGEQTLEEYFIASE